jgi:hypothetical protein
VAIQGAALIAAGLAASDRRVLLFCVASDTDWEHAGITGTTVTAMIVRRSHSARCRAAPADEEERAVLAAPLAKGG